MANAVTNPTPDNLRTVKEVALRLQVSASKVYDLLQRGALPYYQVGGSKRISEAQLQQYLEQSKVERADVTARPRLRDINYRGSAC